MGMLLCAQVNIRTQVLLIKTHVLLLTMYLGGSVCNGVGVGVAVQHPDIFGANRFLYICITVVQIKVKLYE